MVARRPPRDPSRIEVVLQAIRLVWEAQPDTRLCQLIVNVAGRDPFYVEDNELVDKLLAHHMNIPVVDET